MGTVPQDPKLYHITHVDNLPSIVADGMLWSDAALVERGGPAASIGMGKIKARRLGLPLTCHPGDMVGAYVPFYFCPRSVMLYLIHMANHPELKYRGGQGPILHLELDLYAVIRWAEEHGRRWAFSLSNAGAGYTEFRSRVDQLDEVSWDAVASTNFRDAAVKEGKQAEFLLKDSAVWHLVRRIGARTVSLQEAAMRAMAGADHRPAVDVMPAWYY